MRQVGATCLCGVELRDSCFSSSHIRPSSTGISQILQKTGWAEWGHQEAGRRPWLVPLCPQQFLYKWRPDFGRRWRRGGAGAGRKKSRREGVGIVGVRGLSPELSMGGSGDRGWSQAEDR